VEQSFEPQGRASEQASILDQAYARAGFDAVVRASAQKHLEQLKDRASRGPYVAAVEFVTAYMRLDDKEQAFAWLAKAAAQRSRFAVELKINPTFDPLRTDPRFEALLPEIFPTWRANTAASKEENRSRAEIKQLCGANHPAKTNRCSSIQAHVAGKSRPGSRARDR
jgi:hypothetical protein